MTKVDPERKSEALDAFLHGKLPADHPEIPKAEAELGVALKSAAQTIQLPAGFEIELERLLMQEARRKPSSMQRGLASAGRSVAWVALAILLLVGFGWVFRTLLPSSAPGTGPTVSLPLTASLPAITVITQATKTRGPEQPTPTLSGEENQTTYNLPMFPGVEFKLQAELPEAPQEVQIYQQKGWPALTAESALLLGQQLGVDGQLYQATSGPPGATSYLVSDGFARVTFQQAVPWFQYSAALNGRRPVSIALSPEQVIAAGENFLTAYDLDNFEYQVETEAERPGEVLFIQTLDGIPVRYSQFDSSKVRVQVDEVSQATQVESNLGNFEPVGSYPILSAQEAWNKVLSPETASGLESSDFSGLSSVRPTWQREYPLNTTIELFGYAQSYPAVDSNLPPLIFFRDYPVGGNTQGLAEAAANNRFVQAWGQFLEDDQGRRKFEVDGWQVGLFPDQSLQGTIEHQDGRTYLVTADQRLMLPDAPDDLPEGKIINAHGVVFEEPEATLDWSSLFLGPLGGGGGGGGSGFAELNLYDPPVTPVEPAQPEPTPTPSVTVGRRLDGIEGNLIVIINQYADGSSQVIVMLHIDDSADWPGGQAVRLDGPGIQGIDAYHNLPVRVWGEISDTSGLMPTLTTERYEPVYPGLKVQAWLGLMESATVGDQQVLLFTTQDGEQFVLNSSIENPGLDEIIGEPNDPVVVEGILIPGQVLGSYPVITDYTVLPMPGTNDMSDYEPVSGKPMVTSKAGTAGERRQGVIDRIELVYQTEDPRYMLPSVDGAPLYVQPVWRFSGKYDDGASFTILVQALKPEYLK
ncbi:MAG: hypothetical protein A2W35_00690 [Chloroflexi bacterium RBG_16_57_11]|nr:MAG: hypothetical protein A2W35_00690 [Chloroflexi bacterium RBG_16_57_11]